MPKKVKVLILGAGLTGLSAAYHLKKEWRILEKEETPGGLARTEEISGCLFDITGHWLHLRNEYNKEWLGSLLGKELSLHERLSHIYTEGVYTDYPYQINTFGLLPARIRENLLGYFSAREKAARGEFAEPKNFAEWIIQNMGEGFAKNFMFPYNSKLWTVSPEEISHLWCKRFVPKPSPEEVIDGALGTNTFKGGYNAAFSYPREGGIQRLPQAIYNVLKGGETLLKLAAKRLSLGEKAVWDEAGERHEYETLISTLPLNKLIEIATDAPEEITSSAKLLRNTSLLYFNIASKSYNAPGSHWVYFPDPELNFYRIGSFSAVNPKMSAEGIHSLYLEIAYRGEIDADKARQRAIEGLIAIGIINSESDILFAVPRYIDCAYVLYDINRERAQTAIIDYLRKNSVISTGRYGKWEYAAMEDALNDGRAAALEIG